MFGWAKHEDVNELISRRNYAKALEILKEELDENPRDRRLRLLYADTLNLAGKRKEAFETLSDLADDLALEAKIPQAIAVLKRIQSIRPGQPDVEKKLAYLLDPTQPAPESWSFARKGEILRAEQEAARAAAREALEAGASTMSNEGAKEPAKEDQPADAAGNAAPSGDAAVPPAAPAPEPAREPVRSILFKDFTLDELFAIVSGLTLQSYEAGSIIVTEGEPGGSLFVVTSGRVRAYVKDAVGHSIPIRELQEGEFFGEISLLTGRERSATVTATMACELLELDKGTVEAIAQTHPRVNEVIKEFYDQRSDNTIEAAIRSAKIRPKAKARPEPGAP